MECVCILHLKEVFDLRVVVRFLLNQRGAVQLTRTEPEHRLLKNKHLHETITGCLEKRHQLASRLIKKTT